MRGTRRNPWRSLTDARVTYALKILMVLVLVFYAGQFIVEILIRLQAVVYILIAAVFLAYLIYPAAQRLRQRMPLVAAIVLIYVGIVLAIVLAAFFVVPHIMDDVQMLVKRYPELLAKLDSLIYNPKNPVTSHLPVWVRDEIGRAPVQVVAWIKTRGLQVFGHIVVLLAGTLAVVAVFIVVPVVTAYLLLDLDHLKASLGGNRPGGAVARNDVVAGRHR